LPEGYGGIERRLGIIEQVGRPRRAEEPGEIGGLPSLFFFDPERLNETTELGNLERAGVDRHSFVFNPLNRHARAPPLSVAGFGTFVT
jgi:hypothetical protein